MKRYIIPIFLLICNVSFAQQSISEMKWGKDYKLHVKMYNDTNYVLDIKGLYHAGGIFADTLEGSSTYYPVKLDQEFIDYVKHKKIDVDDLHRVDSSQNRSGKTLWSALHADLGGGYIHFINCLIYSLESQQVRLSEPIMLRPETKWKPKPVTDTYRRTRRWIYFVPFDQKQAHKEYNLRKRQHDLSDLQGVPESFIVLFRNTSQKEYELLRKENKRHLVAQIDLIRLLLGARYLGESQIQYVRSRVRSAVLKYSQNTLPSVVIFDNYNAAVALSLDQTGYKVDYIVFRDQDLLTAEENAQRVNKIKALIITINEANNRVFRSRLEDYYQK